ncbi:MAG: anthranilate synthase component I [Acidobacteriota bacterium]
MNDPNRFLAAAASGELVPVVDTIPADLMTPVGVYLKLSAAASHSFLLESVAGGETLARYSFIGVSPEMIVSGSDSGVTVTDGDGSRRLETPMIEFLREHFANNRIGDVAGLPTFAGGAIGYISFDCAGWFEPTLRRPVENNGGPAESIFMFFRSIVAFDHAKQEIKIITLVRPSKCDDTDTLSRRYSEAKEKNRSVRAHIERGEIPIPEVSQTAGQHPTTSNFTQKEFEDAVRDVKERIAAGDCYQIVLSQCFSRATAAPPAAIYRAVRSLNPSPYMFLLHFGSSAIIGASPEMLVRCRGNDIEYRPIAGTRPRGQTPFEDAGLAADMQVDAKEVAEHVMLVDLGRNDVGRIAEFGSVCVKNLMTVEKYSHVQHMVSSITGKLKLGLDRFDALASCFPAGTVSGAPKVRAIEIIRELEPTPRGVYAGAVGYFDYAGNMDTCIAIRTLVLEDGVAKVQAGAGIVADSIPESEYIETVNKAAAMLRTIEIAEEHD